MTATGDHGVPHLRKGTDRHQGVRRTGLFCPFIEGRHTVHLCMILKIVQVRKLRQVAYRASRGVYYLNSVFSCVLETDGSITLFSFRCIALKESRFQHNRNPFSRVRVLVGIRVYSLEACQISVQVLCSWPGGVTVAREKTPPLPQQFRIKGLETRTIHARLGGEGCVWGHKGTVGAKGPDRFGVLVSSRAPITISKTFEQDGGLVFKGIAP